MALHPAEQFVIAVRQMKRRAKGDAQKLALAVRLRAMRAMKVSISASLTLVRAAKTTKCDASTT